MFCLETFILDIFQITEKKQQYKNKQFIGEQLTGNSEKNDLLVNFG